MSDPVIRALDYVRAFPLYVKIIAIFICTVSKQRICRKWNGKLYDRGNGQKIFRIHTE